MGNNKANHGNNHKLETPSTKVDKGQVDDEKFTSYDTDRKETEDVQKVRKAIEPEGEQERYKKGKGEM